MCVIAKISCTGCKTLLEEGFQPCDAVKSGNQCTEARTNSGRLRKVRRDVVCSQCSNNNAGIEAVPVRSSHTYADRNESPDRPRSVKTISSRGSSKSSNGGGYTLRHGKSHLPKSTYLMMRMCGVIR